MEIVQKIAVPFHGCKQDMEKYGQDQTVGLYLQPTSQKLDKK